MIRAKATQHQDGVVVDILTMSGALVGTVYALRGMVYHAIAPLMRDPGNAEIMKQATEVTHEIDLGFRTGKITKEVALEFFTGLGAVSVSEDGDLPVTVDRYAETFKVNEERERAMYGCTVRGLKEIALQFTEGPYPQGLTRGAFSILSDAQELISMGRSEEARQAINRAKFFMDMTIVRT